MSDACRFIMDENRKSNHLSHESKDPSLYEPMTRLNYYDHLDGKQDVHPGVGENIAMNSGNVDGAQFVLQWMESPAHRKMIESSKYDLLGVGCSGKHWCCQLFGNSKSSRAKKISHQSKRDYCRAKSGLIGGIWKYDRNKKKCVRADRTESFEKTCFNSNQGQSGSFEEFKKCDGIKLYDDMGDDDDDDDDDSDNFLQNAHPNRYNDEYGYDDYEEVKTDTDTDSGSGSDSGSKIAFALQLTLLLV